MSKPPEVTLVDGRGGFDLDSRHRAVAVLDDDSDPALVAVAT